jgi:hypothetical protein
VDIARRAWLITHPFQAHNAHGHQRTVRMSIPAGYRVVDGPKRHINAAESVPMYQWPPVGEAVVT